MVAAAEWMGAGGAAALCLHAGSGGQRTRVPWSKHRSLKDSERASESWFHGRQLDGSGRFTVRECVRQSEGVREKG